MVLVLLVIVVLVVVVVVAAMSTATRVLIYTNNLLRGQTSVHGTV